MSSYNLTEPFPSTATRIHSGRGGAGNTTSTTSLSTRNRKSASSGITSSSTRAPFSSGRGGAGNIHQASERAMFSFDEELDRLNKANNVAPICHIGRGGAGNYTRNTTSSSGSNRAASVSSNDSASAGKSSMDWVRNKFGRS